MYPKRKRRSRTRRLLSRLPIAVVGLMLATASMALASEVGGMDARQIDNAALQIVGLMGLLSFSAMAIGSVMQFANRSAVRDAGFAGIGAGLFLTAFMTLFATSI